MRTDKSISEGRPRFLKGIAMIKEKTQNELKRKSDRI
jgi:hypothetical protein